MRANDTKGRASPTEHRALWRSPGVRLAAVAVALATVAGASALSVRRAEPPRAAAAQESPQVWPQGFQVPARVGRISRQPLSLELAASVSATALLGGRGADAREVRTHVGGTLVELALDGSGQSLLSVEDAEVELGGTRNDAAETALATGIVVDRDPRGALTRVRFPRGAIEGETTILRALAYSVEWTAPPDGAAHWTAREPSPDGPADVAYSLEGASLLRRIDGVGGPGAGAAAELSIHGELRGEVEPLTRRLLDIRGAWRVRRVNGGGAEAVRWDVNVRIDPGSFDHDVARAAATLLSLEERYGGWTDLDAAIVDAAAVARRTDDLARSMTPEDALRRLRSSDVGARARATAALQALMERSPEACAAVAKDILAAGLHDPSARAELSLLAGVGNPASQRAIADVVRGSAGSDGALSVIPLLGQVSQPTPETLAFLRAARDDAKAPELARTADLALGSAASHLAAGDPAAADAIAQSLETRLHGATDPSDIAETLAALGNTRSPRILDTASQYIQSDDVFVRRMAASALGLSPDAEATTLLQQMSTGDADPRVRGAAMRALARRNAG